MAVLDRGVQRTQVIAELGAPVWSDRPDIASVDVFKFKQGYSKTTKAARALAHGAADVATFGLWEVIGIPMETVADGTDVQVEVHYNPDQTVNHVVVIEGEKAVHPPEAFAFKRLDSAPSEVQQATAISPQPDVKSKPKAFASATSKFMR
jgi:hypothetical protein